MFELGTLDQLADITMGQSPKGSSVSNSGEIPLLNGPTEFGINHPTPVQFTDDPKRFAKKGDLLFCVRGSTGRMNWADQDYAIGRGLAAIRPKDGSSYYFLRGSIQFFLKHLLSGATGSVFTSINKDQLHKMECFLPDEYNLKKINQVLGNISRKIELNQQMNETLEGIAKTLFKSWFIDFDPVRAKVEGMPTGLSKEISDLFPDSFEDSELGEIPTSWRCSSISSKYDFLSGFAFKSKDWIEEGVPVVKIKSIDSGIVDLDSDTFVSEEFLSTKSSYILNEGDILIAMTGATIGKVGVVPISTKKSLLNQRVGKFIHRDNSKNFFLNCFVSSRIFLKNIENLATGSARDNISKDQILSIKTIIPTDDVYNKFGELTEDIRKKILIANNENKILEKLRDSLLPKLISGEIKISDAKSIVKEASI
jgi:type I restriction enzyme S subunit